MSLSQPTNSVILNLFQDPSRRKFGASGGGTLITGSLPVANSSCGDKWALKRVQGDEEKEGLK